MSKYHKFFTLSFYKQLPDAIIRHSNWYRDMFEDANRISRIPQHLDMINVGSNPAKFGLDYSECGIKGWNLAVGPQTIEYDFKILKNYHSYLDDNGARQLLLVLSPFSMCKARYTKNDGDVWKDVRYYRILHRAMLNHYDETLYERWIRHPYKLGARAMWHILRNYRCGRPILVYSNPLTEEQMEQSADSYISLWRQEFGVSDFEQEENHKRLKDALTFNSDILDQIIAFCKERAIHPTIVLPPLSSQLNKRIPQKFIKRCLVDILKEKDIQILDYSKDERFCRHEFFLNALFLNKKGRIAFTNQVTKDILQKGAKEKR